MRDLYIQDDWTRRFTDLVDKHIDLSDAENLLYVNAGTGGHTLVLDEKFGEKIDIFASCENEHLLTIARDKGIAVRSNVDFSMLRFDEDSFDAVLADASFVRPDKIEEFIEDVARPARSGADVAMLLPTNGSFGEIFSLLWEVLFDEDFGEQGAVAEKLVAELPTVSQLETIAARLGLVNVNTETVNEIFEYADGAAFVASPLIADFLLPIWLETFDEEQRSRLSEKLVQLIDEEDGTLSFSFSVKVTLLSGERA